MNTKKYIVRGGYVTSKNDRKRHYISPREVAGLYGVPHSECLFPSCEANLLGLSEELLSQLIALGPKSNGDYSLDKRITEFQQNSKNLKKCTNMGRTKGTSQGV